MQISIDSKKVNIEKVLIANKRKLNVSPDGAVSLNLKAESSMNAIWERIRAMQAEVGRMRTNSQQKALS